MVQIDVSYEEIVSRRADPGAVAKPTVRRDISAFPTLMARALPARVLNRMATLLQGWARSAVIGSPQGSA